MKAFQVVFIILVVIVYVIACKLLWTWQFTPRKSKTITMSKKRMKVMKEQLSVMDMQKRRARALEITRIFKKVPMFGLNDVKRKHLQTLIMATNQVDSTGAILLPEELYIRQLGYMGIGVAVITMIAIMAGNIAILFAIVLTPVLGKFVTASLEEEQLRTSRAITSQFLEFYKVYYVQFSRRDNATPLASIANSFIPMASSRFQIALSRLVADAESGEEYALAAFDSRFPDNPKVHKFCSVAKSRIKGDDASYDSMKNLFDELQEERDAFYNIELSRRETQIKSIVSRYLIIVFSIILSVMMLAMVNTA